jgi:hypothetical protein
MGVLVVDVQGRNDAFVDYACAASAVGHSRFLHLTAEDQVHLSGSAQIDILANNLLEKAAPAHCLVPDLSEGKFRLQYG